MVKSVFTGMMHPERFNPAVITKNISQLDYRKMQRLGFQKLIFDKDNTLTAPNENRFFNENIERAFKKAVRRFGE